MPGLYGIDAQGDTGTTLYGGGPQANVNQPLSQKNQDMAQQLGLPSSAAGSQQAAQSDYANFEDIFNRNQTYNKNALENSKNAVALKGVVRPTSQQLEPVSNQRQTKNSAVPERTIDTPSVNNVSNNGMVQAPAAINPAAPVQLRGSNLGNIQSKADMLAGYGAPSALGAGASGATQLGSTPQTEAPVYSQQADTATGGRNAALPSTLKAPAAGFPAQTSPLGPAPVQTAPDSDGDGVPDNPFEGPQDGHDTGATNAPVTPASAAPAGVDPKASAGSRGFKEVNPLAGPAAQANAPLADITKDEYARDDQLTQQNNMLAGWGQDNGLEMLKGVYGPEASQYDADLMATGGGRTAQAELSKKYGQEQKDFRKGVEDRVNSERAQADAARKRMSLLAGLGAKQQGEATPGGAPTEAQAPGENTADADLEDLLFGEDNPAGQAFSSVHWAGMTLNPADWATIGMGEAGTDVEPTTELFSKMYDVTGGKIQDSWGEGKFLMAFNMLVDNGVGQKVSEQSRKAFLRFLRDNPDMKQQYLTMKNPGYMARNMRMWMASYDKTHNIDPNPDVLGSDPYKKGQTANMDPDNPDVRH